MKGRLSRAILTEDWSRFLKERESNTFPKSEEEKEMKRLENAILPDGRAANLIIEGEKIQSECF